MTVHKESHSKSILILGIFSLLAVGSWMMFDVYRGMTKVTTPQVLQEEVQPLTGTIEAETIGRLMNRRQFDEATLSQVQSKVAVSLENNREAAILNLLGNPEQGSESANFQPAQE